MTTSHSAATSTKTMRTMSPIEFLTLPSEVIEAILVCSCSPRTVTCVAQTCRKLHTLVYSSPDSHLWRELFLTTWDDPRPALEHRALIDPRIDPASWNWETEYRRRVSADRWLKSWRRDICLADDEPTEEGDKEWYAAALSTLSTVLDTLLTLHPFPASPPIALTIFTPTISAFPTGNVESGVGETRERMANAPPLPPLLIVLASGFSAFRVSRSAIRIGRMVYGPHASRASDDGASIPTPCLPPQLLRTLLAVHAVGVHGLPKYVPRLSGVDYWGEDVLGDAFHRIICITGFVAIPPPITPIATMSTSGSVPSHSPPSAVDANDRRDANSDKRSSPEAFPTPLKQHADARTLAKRRVYNMQYLRGDRLWGPYHSVTAEVLKGRHGDRILDASSKAKIEKGDTRASASGAMSRRRGWRNRLAWVMGATDGISDDDNEDEDWHDAAETGPETSASQDGNRMRDQATDDEDVMDIGDTDHAIGMNSGQSFISEDLNFSDTVGPEATQTTPDPDTTESKSSRRRTRRSNPRRPPKSVSPRDIKPEHLRPDYTYLASVRIVVEANLRELFNCEIPADVEGTASETRVGDVGMFWEDEDEILRERAGSSTRLGATSLPHGSSLPAAAPGGSSVENEDSRSFELADILSRFQDLEVARLGSACGYWSAWVGRQEPGVTSTSGPAGASALLPKDDTKTRRPRIVAQRDRLEKSINLDVSTTGDKGKAKAGSIGHTFKRAVGPELGDWEIGPEGDACDGWDWAGVAGIWRRCVCWMDYRELIFFNLDPTKFIDLGDTREECHIIPMELRITGYTRSGLMPIYNTAPDDCDTYPSQSKRHPDTDVRFFRPPPVIHFSGSSVGSDRGSDDGRSVSGTVQLIGGGEVRWQMDTYRQDSFSPGSNAPEWSSEAVQVGGIGSAIGLLGMWTGAEHERADPLGPFWAWKVT